MTAILYGIPNCDTVKKARTWLDAKGTPYHFHDFKKAGLDSATVKTWMKQVSWETLINRKGTTWRNLPDERKAAIVDAATAQLLMLENPSVIKRPVLVTNSTIQVGFTPDLYQQIF
jgi:arsenate reductase